MGFLNGIYSLIMASYLSLFVYKIILYHGHRKILNSDWLELKLRKNVLMFQIENEISITTMSRGMTDMLDLMTYDNFCW